MNTYNVQTQTGIYRSFGNTAEEAIEKVELEQGEKAISVYPVRD